MIFIRVTGITAACMLFAFIFWRGEFIFSQLIVLSLILILALELAGFVKKSNRELHRFLASVRDGDISANFSDDHLGPAFRDLAGSFRDMIRELNAAKIEKEAHYQLLQAIVDRIGFGIITFEGSGEIILMNTSAGKVLGTSKVLNWNHLKTIVPEFCGPVEEMAHEGRKLIELEKTNEKVALSAAVNRFKILELDCTVVTFHDIRYEIEEKEIEAWFKLIRVLTHEIMNSLTPLSSLTDTILMLLGEGQGEEITAHPLSPSVISDVRRSVMTIRSRSRGILQFVEAYRKLTLIPSPDRSDCMVEELIRSTLNILKPEIESRKISIETEVRPGELAIRADKNLMEQVLINLLTNSMYALAGTPDPKIRMNAKTDGTRVEIAVTDNGRGIEPSKMDKIFIPFFSTREGGSGIGLSFSKQVIHQHHGRIRVTSDPGISTTFTIELPCRQE